VLNVERLRFVARQKHDIFEAVAARKRQFRTSLAVGKANPARLKLKVGRLSCLWLPLPLHINIENVSLYKNASIGHRNLEFESRPGCSLNTESLRQTPQVDTPPPSTKRRSKPNSSPRNTIAPLSALPLVLYIHRADPSNLIHK
jgi:hypothetical protein